MIRELDWNSNQQFNIMWVLMNMYIRKAGGVFYPESTRHWLLTDYLIPCPSAVSMQSRLSDLTSISLKLSTTHIIVCTYFAWWDIIIRSRLNFQKSIALPLIMKYWRSSSCNRYNWREESSGRDGKPTRDSCCEVKVKFQYLYLWTVTFKSAQAHVCLSFRQLVDEQLTKKTSFYTTVPLDQLPGPVYHESTLTADILKYKAAKISYTVSTLTHRLECQEWIGRSFLYLKPSLLNLSHPQICVSSGVQPLWLP